MSNFFLRLAMISCAVVMLAIPCLAFATTAAMWVILIGTGTLVGSGVLGVILDWREINHK